MEVDPLDAYMAQIAVQSPVQSREAAANDWQQAGGARRERTAEERQQQIVRNR